jgi:predicted PurR-regulated permease PerM
VAAGSLGPGVRSPGMHILCGMDDLSSPSPLAAHPERHREVLQAAFLLLAVSGAVAVFVFAYHIVLLGFVALLVATVFSFPVDFLSRAVPRGVAVILVLLALLGLVYVLGSAAAPVLSRQAAQLQESAPRAIRSVETWLGRLQPQHAGKGGPPSAPGRPSPPADSQVSQALAVGARALVGVLGGVTEVVLMIFLAAFLVYRPKTYREGLKKLVPRSREPAYDELWERLRYGLRHWVGGVLVAMTLMGSLAAIGLWLAGVESWLLLGVLTFLGTFVPYLGAVASAIPGLLSALSQDPSRFLYALVVYLAIHIVEGYIVEPFVMRRAIALNPALLLFGQGLFGALFGVLGVVVATPAIICLQIIVETLWVEKRLGKRSELSMVPPEKAPAQAEEKIAVS